MFVKIYDMIIFDSGELLLGKAFFICYVIILFYFVFSEMTHISHWTTALPKLIGSLSFSPMCYVYSHAENKVSFEFSFLANQILFANFSYKNIFCLCILN